MNYINSRPTIKTISWDQYALLETIRGELFLSSVNFAIMKARTLFLIMWLKSSPVVPVLGRDFES